VHPVGSYCTDISRRTVNKTVNKKKTSLEAFKKLGGVTKFSAFANWHPCWPKIFNKRKDGGGRTS